MNKPLNIPFGLKPINEELLNTFQQLDNTQLQWLSGYCAGLAQSNNSNKRTQEIEISFQQLKTVILYGSQTGNSESLAKQLYAQLNNETLTLQVESMDRVKVKDLSKYDLIILVVSTHGEGEPPDEAIEFYEHLNHKRAPKLSQSQHAVLALGDSSYEYFCQTGEDFDNRLQYLGSKPILERLECDLDYQEQAVLWMEKLVSLISEQSNQRLNSSLVQSNDSDFILGSTAQSKENSFNKTNLLTAKIITNQRITGKGSTKTVHHIEISLEGETFYYLPGDGVAVWAKNDSVLVDQILNLMSLSGSENIEFKSSTQSLRKTLSENLELTLLNSKTINLIIELLNVKNQALNEPFKQLVKAPEFIKNNQFIDLLILANKNISLNAQQLVDLLPVIKVRVYSISSSQSVNPDELHITVALNNSENERGVRKGMASHYLIELLEDDDVLIYLEPNIRFRLPKEDKPIIMIGSGTGIAPFRSFIQERGETNASGENWLFFGNSHFNSDFLYQTEWQQLFKKNKLTKFDAAFSRDQKNKIYVQDKLLTKAQEIWHWIDKKDAYLYVCGDMNYMAKDVQQSLLDIISQQGNKNKSDAKTYLKQLIKDNRYQRDVY